MNEREFLNLVAKESSFLVAAHEMKTPLSIIRQLSLTLNDDDTEISDDERSRILRQIDITSERALRLVQDLTKISKLEDAMFELEPINSKKICQFILEEFGLTSQESRIVNGHTPVKTGKGESPIRGEGLLFVIDGGLCEAYQKKTGTAGYSLLNNSYGFQLVTHQPFQNVQKIVESPFEQTSFFSNFQHVSTQV